MRFVQITDPIAAARLQDGAMRVLSDAEWDSLTDAEVAAVTDLGEGGGLSEPLTSLLPLGAVTDVAEEGSFEYPALYHDGGGYFALLLDNTAEERIVLRFSNPDGPASLQVGLNDNGNASMVLTSTSTDVEFGVVCNGVTVFTADEDGIEVKNKDDEQLIGTDSDGDMSLGVNGILRLKDDGRVVMDQLPTMDPVFAGELWNDAGTLKVSAG